jgi:phage terminase small subunit
MADKKLTPKQKKFIAAYDGNATQAAIAAGYSKNTARSIANENLTKPHIAEAVAKRQEKEERSLIATRAERQKFWTEIMMAAEAELRDRLRASELLGKSEADFTEKVQVSVDQDLAIRLDSAREKLKKLRD